MEGPTQPGDRIMPSRELAPSLWLPPKIWISRQTLARRRKKEGICQDRGPRLPSTAFTRTSDRLGASGEPPYSAGLELREAEEAFGRVGGEPRELSVAVARPGLLSLSIPNMAWLLEIVPHYDRFEALVAETVGQLEISLA
jgi:hypothetical protein